MKFSSARNCVVCPCGQARGLCKLLPRRLAMICNAAIHAGEGGPRTLQACRSMLSSSIATGDSEAEMISDMTGCVCRTPHRFGTAASGQRRCLSVTSRRAHLSAVAVPRGDISGHAEKAETQRTNAPDVITTELSAAIRDNRRSGYSMS
jgi:hypothetical protein